MKINEQEVRQQQNEQEMRQQQNAQEIIRQQKDQGIRQYQNHNSYVVRPWLVAHEASSILPCSKIALALIHNNFHLIIHKQKWSTVWPIPDHMVDTPCMCETF